VHLPAGLRAVATCVSNRMAATGCCAALSVASDAPEMHPGLRAGSLLSLRGVTVFPAGRDTGLNRSSLEYAMVEKVVCAKASVFISQERSSFSGPHLAPARGLQPGQLLGRAALHRS